MRNTGNAPDYIRHTYKVLKVLKSYTIFERVKVENNTNLLTDIIRIEKFRGKSNATNIDYYLRLRNTSNWSKCEMVTGLRKTKIRGLFYGNRQVKNKFNTIKKTLLIFVVPKDPKTLIVDVYRGFYPNHNGILQTIINAYKTN